MGNYSIQDIENWFRNLNTYKGDEEDPFTLQDIIWPCVLENAHIESKEDKWERKFWFNYSLEVHTNVDDIVSLFEKWGDKPHSKEVILDYAQKIING
ncbi:MAG: hypothetical protein ACR2M6_02755 [Vampirovibrionia bacterium]